MGKKNPVAFVLRTAFYRPRKTKVVKGRGAYTRKSRHQSGRTDGVFFCAYMPPFRVSFFSFVTTRGTGFLLSSENQSNPCSNCGEITLY
jgi:hypothetical protein